MSDDFDDLNALRDAMKAATPKPDATRRAENLALARKNFDDLQGSAKAPRPTPVTGLSGLFQGVKTMLNALTTKGGLTATTALVACGFLFLTPGGQDLLRPKGPIGTTVAEGDVPVAPTIAPQTQNLPTDEIAKQVQAPVAPVAVPVPETVEQMPMAADAVGGVVQAPAGSDLDRSRGPDASGSALGNPGLGAVADEAPVMDGIIAAEPAPPPVMMPAPSATMTWSLVAPENGRLQMPEPNTEAFANATDNPLKITAESPVSTFSIDVDTASYSLIRNSLTRGQLPPADAVRIEEMINYFPYDYAAPAPGGDPFQPTVTVAATPWNPDTELVTIGIQGIMPDVDNRPPLNLVFLIDTSGSMDDPAKLPLLKQSFRLMLDNLRPTDQVAIVEYAGSAGEVLKPTPASDRTAILKALNSLGAGGSTNGQGGLQQAYQVAEGMAHDGDVSRVILATDGDFNVGLNDPQALKDYIAGKRTSGVYLSVLGFGRGNLDDATMQALAQNGNGTAAYIDTLSEAQKVLVDQLTGALFPIADDVKIQIEWNPAAVSEYRLIGYETRALNREDFNNDKVDAGELGAGTRVTAIYEVTPVGSPGQHVDPLRYGMTTTAAEPAAEMGFLKLRYKNPGEADSHLIEAPITHATVAGTDQQFAAAIAGFGQLLKGNGYLGTWGYADAIALANANRGDDPFGYRTEAVQLMRLAQSLSGN